MFGFLGERFSFLVDLNDNYGLVMGVYICLFLFDVVELICWIGLDFLNLSLIMKLNMNLVVEFECIKF